MHASFHNIKKIILENVEYRQRDKENSYYVFTMDITDDKRNKTSLTFFSHDKNGLDFIKKDNS